MMTEGRDETTGQFTKGNRFWEARSSAGPKPKFAGPEPLWAMCVEYFEWNEANPLWEAKAFSYQGETKIEKLPKMRAMTLGALCRFLDVGIDTWTDWRSTRPDLSEVLRATEEIIRSQKFEGAAADLLNANIIARDLGLADKMAHGGDPDGVPIKTESVSELELARQVAFLLAKGMKAAE